MKKLSPLIEGNFYILLLRKLVLFIYLLKIESRQLTLFLSFLKNEDPMLVLVRGDIPLSESELNSSFPAGA